MAFWAVANSFLPHFNTGLAYERLIMSGSLQNRISWAVPENRRMSEVPAGYTGNRQYRLQVN